MNTETVSPAVKNTMRLSFVEYIAQCVQRFHYFSTNDSGRASSVRYGVEAYMKAQAPRGSGFDAGTTLDIDASNATKLVFITSFHHMDEHGGYDGWTEHKVVVTPAFYDFDTRVTGRDRNRIKEYIGEVFHTWLGNVTDQPALVEVDFEP